MPPASEKRCEGNVLFLEGAGVPPQDAPDLRKDTVFPRPELSELHGQRNDGRIDGRNARLHASLLRNAGDGNELAEELTFNSCVCAQLGRAPGYDFGADLSETLRRVRLLQRPSHSGPLLPKSRV